MEESLWKHRPPVRGAPTTHSSRQRHPFFLITNELITACQPSCSLAGYELSRLESQHQRQIERFSDQNANDFDFDKGRQRLRSCNAKDDSRVPVKPTNRPISTHPILRPQFCHQEQGFVVSRLQVHFPISLRLRDICSSEQAQRPCKTNPTPEARGHQIPQPGKPTIWQATLKTKTTTKPSIVRP